MRTCFECHNSFNLKGKAACQGFGNFALPVINPVGDANLCANLHGKFREVPGSWQERTIRVGVTFAVYDNGSNSPAAELYVRP